MTKREKQVVSAHTGIMMCKFAEFQEYVEEILGRRICMHELSDDNILNEIIEKSLREYVDICKKETQEVKHAHWFIAWDGEIICSVCKKHNPVHLMRNFPFCPYCGAVMDEEEEHEKVSFD